MFAEVYVSSCMQGRSPVTLNTLCELQLIVGDQIKHDELQAKVLAAMQSRLTEHNTLPFSSSGIQVSSFCAFSPTVLPNLLSDSDKDFFQFLRRKLRVCSNLIPLSPS